MGRTVRLRYLLFHRLPLWSLRPSKNPHETERRLRTFLTMETSPWTTLSQLPELCVQDPALVTSLELSEKFWEQPNRSAALLMERHLMTLSNKSETENWTSLSNKLFCHNL